MNCKMAGLMGAAAGGAAGHVAQKKMQEKSEARLEPATSADVLPMRTLAMPSMFFRFL